MDCRPSSSRRMHRDPLRHRSSVPPDPSRRSSALDPLRHRSFVPPDPSRHSSISDPSRRRRSSTEDDDYDYCYPGVARTPPSRFSSRHYTGSIPDSINFEAQRDQPHGSSRRAYTSCRDKTYHNHVVHINRGKAVVVNPEDIPKVEVTLDLLRPEQNQRFDSAPPEEKGPPTLAFIFGPYAEIMIAVNHKPGGIPNIVLLPNMMVATMTGPDISRCRSLLSELDQKCKTWQRDNLDIITAAKAAQLMADTLASCCEVGLIAGWDSGMSPDLYRVDSTGILIKGEKLVSGSDVARAYAVLNDVGDLAGEEEIEIPGIPLPPPLDMPFSRDRKYKDWSSWSDRVAAFWAKRVICDVASNSAEGLPLATVLLLGRFGGMIHVTSMYESVKVTDFMDKNELRYSKPVLMGSFDDMTRGQGDTRLVT